MGATVAYTLAIQSEVSELVLVDKNLDRAKGEALDLTHGVPFIPYVSIDYGDVTALGDVDLIIVTAGAPRTNESSRLDLARANTELFKKLIPSIDAVNSKALYLIASNPVDILTYATIKFSGRSPERVIGSGNVLDSLRFRSLIGQYFKVEPGNVNAYLLGEHGESAVPIWSEAFVGCTPLRSMEGYDKKDMKKIFLQATSVSKEIIDLKGSTYYAVSLCIKKIVQAIYRNKNKVMPVSTLLTDYYGISNVCLSVPTVINRRGVSRTLKIPLSKTEHKLLKNSANILGGVLDDLGLRVE